MTRIEFKFAALAAAMALAATGGVIAAATPAFGAGLVVNGSNVPTARVGYADLDLRSRAGVLRLERRVDAAADRLCVGVGIETLAARLDGFKCREKAIAAAAPQVRRAVERAGTEQAANGGAITLTLLR
jgi:UrcA family protein